MAETNVAVTAGSGTPIAVFVDPSSNNRQVVVVGDSTAASVQGVDTLGNASIKAPDVTATGNITTQNLVPAGSATAGSAVATTALDGKASVAVQVTGTYTGALSVQASVDGSAWVTLGGVPLLNVNTGVYSATIASASVGIWQVDSAGFNLLRVTGLAAMTGTAVVTIRASVGNSMVGLDAPLPTGTNTVGAVTLVDVVATGTISATDALGGTPGGSGALIATAPTANSFVALALAGCSTADIQILGATSGAFYFEVSADSTTGSDGNWMVCYFQRTGLTTPTIGYSSNFGGLYQGNVAGMKYVRVRNVGGSSPSNAITIRGGNNPALVSLSTPLPAGANAIGVVDTELAAAAALADGTSNPFTASVGGFEHRFNGATWDRVRGLFNTTTGDSGAKTTTGTGATQTNYNNLGAQILFVIGTVTGTTPTLQMKLQGSADSGTTWYDIPGATMGSATVTATGNYLCVIYPTGTAVANNTSFIATSSLPRTWRVAWTITGTTPSFTITSVQVAYLL